VLTSDDDDFADQVVAALGREAAEMPVAVHEYNLGAPDETLSAAKAVILPARLAARPSEALRVWLQGYDGTRLVVPTPAEGWLWVFGSGRSRASLARQAARMARHLAERKRCLAVATLALDGGGVVIAGLIGLFSLTSLLSMVVEWFAR
jgi:hypothetical protein